MKQRKQNQNKQKKQTEVEETKDVEEAAEEEAAEEETRAKKKTEAGGSGSWSRCDRVRFCFFILVWWMAEIRSNVKGRLRFIP